MPEESSVYGGLTAWDNLMFTARLYRVPRTERAERAQELLKTFGVGEKRDVKVVAIINHGRIAAIDTPERLKRAFQQRCRRQRERWPISRR